MYDGISTILSFTAKCLCLTSCLAEALEGAKARRTAAVAVAIVVDVDAGVVAVAGAVTVRVGRAVGS